MNPREGGAFASTEETSTTRAMSTWIVIDAGARAPVPPVYGSGRPAFSPPTVLRGRGRIFPAPARGNPAPHGWRAISRGVQRFVTVTSRHLALQVKLHRSPDRSASQADSAGSIPVIRTVIRSNQGLLVVSGS